MRNGKRWSRILAIARKEFRQAGRDRRSLGILVFLPVFMLLMFGYAVNFDVRDIAIAVHDADGSPHSRALLETFTSSGYFHSIGSLEYPGAADRLLDRETVRAVVIIPAGFSENILRGLPAPVQILIDGSNAAAAATVAGYVNAVVRQHSAALATEFLYRFEVPGGLEPVGIRTRIWFNPELRSPVFLIPGLIAFILMITAVISTALSIVREKERGTMEQIAVSPVQPVELIVGKTLPYAATSFTTTILILLGGYILFDVKVAGSFAMLFLLVVLFLAGALGWGLILSATSATQQAAFMKALTTTFLPVFLLSGFVFPIHNMPWPIQAVTYVIPARYFLEGLRAIMVKGVGVEAYWEQLLALLIFAAVLLIGSAIRLKRGGLAT